MTLGPIFNPDRDEWTDAYLTHDWWDLGGEVRCGKCDCRPSGAWATWPCGADVPYETIGETR